MAGSTVGTNFTPYEQSGSGIHCWLMCSKQLLRSPLGENVAYSYGLKIVSHHNLPVFSFLFPHILRFPIPDCGDPLLIVEQARGMHTNFVMASADRRHKYHIHQIMTIYFHAISRTILGILAFFRVSIVMHPLWAIKRPAQLLRLPSLVRCISHKTIIFQEINKSHGQNVQLYVAFTRDQTKISALLLLVRITCVQAEKISSRRAEYYFKAIQKTR